MKKTYCKNCGRLLTSNSKFCDKCGSSDIEVKKDKTMLIVGSAIGGVLLIFIVFIGLCIKLGGTQASSTTAKANSETIQDNKNNSKTEVKSKEDNQEILSNDYISFGKDYEAMTDIQKDDYYKKVKEKWVQWTGTITDVKDDYICIKCLETTLTYDAQCYVKKSEQSKLINLQKDSQITIKGQINTQAGSILPWGLKECTIVEK